MRPIKLTMSAFGPYAGAAEVDFSKFDDNGIFLITGDTGAGKTTIFDGMSYALYGEASGGKNRRVGKSFRSDFAALTDETFVEFTFSHRNITYRIRRSPDYERKKLRGEGTTVKTANAEFECIDTGEVLSGVDAVEKRVRELIGLDQSQFSQTVMIAQGDFLKILNAKSDERKALFQKLFDTLDFEYVQRKLKEKNDEAAAALDEIKAEIRGLLDRIVIDEEFSEKESLDGYTADEKYITQTIPILQKMVSEQGKRHEAAKTAVKELTEKQKAADAEYIKSEAVNKDFAKLHELENSMEAILSEEKRIESDKSRLSAAALAAGIEPIEALLIQSRKDVAAEEALLCKNDEKKTELEQRLPEYEAAMNEAKKAAEQAEPIKETAGKYRSGAEVVKKYTSLSKKYRASADALEKLLAESNEKDAYYTEIKNRYYRSQSGLLALQLTEGTACPVCGSTHHPRLAVLEGASATWQDVEDADSARKEAESKLADREKTTAELKTACEGYLEQMAQLGINEDADHNELIKQADEMEAQAKNLLELKESAEKAYDDALVGLEKAKSAAESIGENLSKLKIREAGLGTEFADALKNCRFENEDEYRNAKLTDKNRSCLESGISEYNEQRASVKSMLADYREKTAGKAPIELSELAELRKKLASEYDNADAAERKLQKSLTGNTDVLAKLKQKQAKLESRRNSAAVISDLYQTVSGQKVGAYGKITFEAYAQQYYFKEVIAAANKRLALLTDGMFTLRCKPQAKNLRSQSGLDLDVLDRSTGKWRDVSTLSGGESFMTSLALALGLSDTVQSRSGQIRLDSMFIDEGFGSLDENALQQAMKMLSGLADGKRLIGVISHVSELKERIDRKVIVKKTVNGSTISMEY